MSSCCLSLQRTFDAWSLKRRLLIGTSIQAVLSLLLMIVVLVITLTIMSQQLRQETKAAFENQARESAERIVQAASNVVDLTFHHYAVSTVVLLAHAYSDLNRTDFPFDTRQLRSYYNWAPLMAPPVVVDPRYNSNISYTTGAFNVARTNPLQGFSQFSTAVNQTLQRTETLQPWLKQLYFTFHPAYISLYAGFEHTGVFREYPSASNGNFQQLINYDCRQEASWYPYGKEQPRQTVFTPVYVDPWIRQSMITTLRSIHHVHTGEFVGTSSGDLLTTSIQRTVARASYLSRGRTILFETNTGTVISDSTWPATQQQTRLLTYVDVGLSEQEWMTVRLTAATGFMEWRVYYIVTRALSSNTYRLCSFVHKDDLFEQGLYPMLQRIDDNNRTNTWILAVVLTFLVLAIPVLLYFIVNSITREIHRVIDDSQKIVANFGRVNLVEGIEMVPVGAENPHGLTGYNVPAEARELQTHLNALVRTLYQQRQQQQQQQQQQAQPGAVAVAPLVNNPYYTRAPHTNDVHELKIDVAFHCEPEPSAPPPAYSDSVK